MKYADRQWEHRLLEMAHVGFEHHSSKMIDLSSHASQLHHAYQHCDWITRKHSRTFYLASALVPRVKKHALRALYAFCRTSDDIVDFPSGNVEQQLKNWQWRALDPQPRGTDLTLLAWSDTRQRFKIPHIYAEQLIEGLSRDLCQARYQNFPDLAAYCYGVASTVGLMSMHIIGFSSKDAIVYAVRLGIALQLTNILRDIGEDWLRGRLYLPLDELHAHQISEEDIAHGVINSNWRDFMRFQIERARELYTSALPGVALLDPDGRFSIGAAAELYRGILAEIEAHDYDVFNHRAYLNTWKKLRRLPGIWWRSRAEYRA